MRVKGGTEQNGLETLTVLKAVGAIHWEVLGPRPEYLVLSPHPKPIMHLLHGPCHKGGVVMRRLVSKACMVGNYVN